MKDRFERFAEAIADVAGSPMVFGAALLIVLGWAMSGPLLRFDETWQLTIGTITTIATFLMVFVIQADSNRTSKAIQVKLDALIHAQQEIDDTLVDVEHQTGEQVDQHKRQLKGVS